MEIDINKNLYLRTINYNDVSSIIENITPNTIRWLPNINYPYSTSDAKKYIKNSLDIIKNEDGYIFVIIFLGKIIGTISIYGIKIEKETKFGILLNENFWNKGIGSLVVERVLEFYFFELNFNKIYSGYIEENITSFKLLNKFGFKKYRIEKNTLIKNKYYNQVIMKLDKEDFLKQKFNKWH